MLSAAKHLDAHPLSPYGILDLCLRLMHIGADLSALIYINDEQVGEMKMKTQPGKFAIALPVST
jgi:hypothetical protein